jgi:hypothetical protein
MVPEEHTYWLQDILRHPSSKIIIITEPDSDDQCHPASDFLKLYSNAFRCDFRARYLKLLRSRRINFKESNPPAYVSWRAGTTTTLFLLGS